MTVLLSELEADKQIHCYWPYGLRKCLTSKMFL